ncbi:hypothetical protein FACS1894180_0870 [Bacteroidia bacterium]|nr:hypothetical protein FACS1894180_0870 [Bacteroidia bacterium]
MKKTTILISTLLLMLVGCSNPQPKFLQILVKERNNNYLNTKNEYFVPSEIFSHFPDNIMESYPVGTTVSLEDNPYRYFFVMSFNNNGDFFKKNEKIAKKLSQDNFMPNDTMRYYVIQVNDFYYKMQDLLINSIPIPDFRFGKHLVEGSGNKTADSLVVANLFSDNNPCGLTEDYEIYVIDTQNEYKTFSEEYKDIFAALPRTKNTGFSRGICINRKYNILIFWTIIF